MATEFDAIKAQKEILAGVSRAYQAFINHARRVEQQLSEAEAAHNAAMLMEASAGELLKFENAKLRALEDEAERRASEKQGGN